MKKYIKVASSTRQPTMQPQVLIFGFGSGKFGCFGFGAPPTAFHGSKFSNSGLLYSHGSMGFLLLFFI